MGEVHKRYETFWTPEYWREYCEGHPVRRYRGQREVALALELLRLEKGQRLLEAGCGYGRLSPALLERGVRWTGVELSPSMAAYCRRTLASSAVLVRGDNCELPFAEASFDRVLCSGVLMHLEDERKALAELVRVLRPGGVLVATGNNLLHPLGPLMHLKAALRPGYLQRFHLPGFYQRELERLGCRVEMVRGDTLLGVGVRLGGLALPPARLLGAIERIDGWSATALRWFGFELWYQAVKTR
ncbi:MAG: class I SAM-dependent methyltransferase [Acidobacteria bacterium]|nr:class I SAM-dependent methyltransferase [Acidobacteriota bacterium]